MKNRNLITNEIAINRIDDDLLNYHPYAKKIQQIIQGYSNNPEPLTIGIYGKWGTGKSSFLNLIEKNIEIFHKEKSDKPYIKFHYNPWIYQTKEEMLFDFFDILGKKLNFNSDEKLKKAGKFIKKYSRYLKSIKLSASTGIPKRFNAGVTIEPYEIFKALGEDLGDEEESLDNLKEKINNTLKSAEKKVIIFIDDIDRLDKNEIFTLFKLIKINANFKNLIFIICLDPEHVSKAIYKRYGNSVKSGKDFLEKIINIPLELPLTEEVDLDFFVKQKIKPVLAKKLIKKEDLEELDVSLRGHYFNSPREIIRVINSFAVSLYAIGDEVNVHDLFWIEYLKIKHFSTYQSIKNYAKQLKSTLFLSSTINFNSQAKGDELSGLRKELSDNRNKAFQIITFLFPINKTGVFSGFYTPSVKPDNVLDANLRVNHINHFEKYFSFHTQGKISELLFANFITEVNIKNSTKALNILKEMLENTSERRLVYRINSEIQTSKSKLHNVLIPFLIENLTLFKDSEDYKHSIQIIQSIALKLSINPKLNKDLVLSIIKELDYSQSCTFLWTFEKGRNVNYIAEIEKVIIVKVKESSQHPFFIKRDSTGFIINIWSKIDLKEFQEYTLTYFNNEENIYAFFKSFPHYWNNSINGIFKNEDYNYLKNELKIDTSALYEKIKQVIINIDDLEVLEDLKKDWDDHSNNSGLQNTQQFAYWYLIDMQKNK